MEKSLEMDFGEWELLPDPKHAFIEFGLGSGKDFLFSEDIDIDYFSNEKNSSSKTREKIEQPIMEGKGIKAVPQPIVMFKKLASKDDEFVDMKAESPKTNSRGIVVPSIEPEPMLVFESEEKEEDELHKDEKDSDVEYSESERKEKQIWRWRLLGGVGALCSLGVAAASLCILVFGGRQLQKHHQQKIQFQIHADEKRIKQVMQQATKLNHAISAVRGVPTTRAHISFGGYYDGL